MTSSDLGKNDEFKVHELDRAQVEQAVSILAAAFDKDPVITFYLNDPERRKKAFRIFFDNIVRAQLKFHHVYAASIGGKVSGVAVWSPPNAAGKTPEDLSGERTARLQLEKLFPLTAEEMLRGFEGLDSFHPAEPHWYLLFIGVDPRAQGTGIGSKLLSPVIHLANESSTLCYLETPFPGTIPFYNHLGFEVTAKLNAFHGAPPIWTMTRPPNPNDFGKS